MPKNKRDSSSGSSSDTSVHDSPPPQKKKSKPEPFSKGGSKSVQSSKDSGSNADLYTKGGTGVRKNGEVSWMISSNKKVTIRSFKGKNYIDIREFYEKDGELLPGKKGVSLTPEVYQKLKSLAPEIDEELNRA